MAETNVDPRYLMYNKDDVERILGSVEHIDDTPTAGSDNPVKSGGVKAALDNYPTKTELSTELGDYPTKTEMNTTLGEYAAVGDKVGEVDDDSSSSE